MSRTSTETQIHANLPRQLVARLDFYRVLKGESRTEVIQRALERELEASETVTPTSGAEGRA